MDTLALLCTLHADGPASLKRLRESELNSIDDVLGCSVETTADVLGLSMAQARRFHREARMLAMRMHTEGLDREERMYPGSASSEPPIAQTQGDGGVKTAPAVTAAEPQAVCDSGDDMQKKPDIAAILAPVMERWDEEEAAAESAAGAPAPAPAEPTAAEDTTDILEGVDQPLRDALRAAGYATLTSLVEVEPLVLSRATGRTYSEACRVNFLAKRALETGGGVATAPPQPSAPAEQLASEPDELADAMRVLKELTAKTESSEERFSPASPESSLPQDPRADAGDQEGAGGPFA
ncbi:MAG: hypothetical protein MK291_05240 [Planctomycetes bacterium]|nr:hypothetical protein [Planctomycetota bacterium]